MPRFYVDESIDLDVEEFLDKCSLDEIEEVIEWLKEGSFTLDKNIDLTQMSGVEVIYEEALTKLHGKWNRLTKEEEDFILKLGSKF